MGLGERARRKELGLWFGGGERGAGEGATRRWWGKDAQVRRPERLSRLKWALAEPKAGEAQQL